MLYRVTPGNFLMPWGFPCLTKLYPEVSGVHIRPRVPWWGNSHISCRRREREGIENRTMRTSTSVSLLLAMVTIAAMATTAHSKSVHGTHSHHHTHHEYRHKRGHRCGFHHTRGQTYAKRHENGSVTCTSCTRCPPGHGVAKRCTATMDTVCEACVQGQNFSSSASRVKTCQPCVECGSFRKILRLCSLERNTVCSNCAKGYFEDEETGECLPCSYCYPQYPGATYRIPECRQKGISSNHQCLPITSPLPDLHRQQASTHRRRRKRKRLSRKNTNVACAKNVLRRIAKALNNCTLDNDTMQKVLSLLTEHSVNKVSSSKIIRQSNEDKI